MEERVKYQPMGTTANRLKHQHRHKHNKPSNWENKHNQPPLTLCLEASYIAAVGASTFLVMTCGLFFGPNFRRSRAGAVPVGVSSADVPGMWHACGDGILHRDVDSDERNKRPWGARGQIIKLISLVDTRKQDVTTKKANWTAVLR